MTEVNVTSSQQQQMTPSPLSGPLTRSVMTTRSAGAALARQQQKQQHHRHSSETLPTSSAAAASSSSSSSVLPSTSAAPAASSPGTSTAAHGNPQQPPPLRGPMTRKRTASINTADAVHPRIQDLSLNTPSTATTSAASPHAPPFDARDLICLCTPAPKVPRPRNGSFFLSVDDLLRKLHFHLHLPLHPHGRNGVDQSWSETLLPCPIPCLIWTSQMARQYRNFRSLFC